MTINPFNAFGDGFAADRAWQAIYMAQGRRIADMQAQQKAKARATGDGLASILEDVADRIPQPFRDETREMQQAGSLSREGRLWALLIAGLGSVTEAKRTVRHPEAQLKTRALALVAAERRRRTR